MGQVIALLFVPCSELPTHKIYPSVYGGRPGTEERCLMQITKDY